LYDAKKAGRDRVVAADTFTLTEQHAAWQGLVRTRKREAQ